MAGSIDARVVILVEPEALLTGLARVDVGTTLLAKENVAGLIRLALRFVVTDSEAGAALVAGVDAAEDAVLALVDAADSVLTHARLQVEAVVLRAHEAPALVVVESVALLAPVAPGGAPAAAVLAIIHLTSSVDAGQGEVVEPEPCRTLRAYLRSEGA